MEMVSIGQTVELWTGAGRLTLYCQTNDPRWILKPQGRDGATASTGRLELRDLPDLLRRLEAGGW